jgi:hypothetical protein
VQQRIKAGSQLPQAAQAALDDHEAQVQRVVQPYQNSQVSSQPVADAIRSTITPEMQQAATRNPKVAATVQQINDLANENAGTFSIKDIDARRQRYNDTLAPFYDKSAQAQSEQPAVMQATKTGVEALRNLQYDTLSDLSGQDIRPLKQKEAALIDYKADVNKQFAQAANAKSNVQPGYFSRVGRAVAKTNPAKETSLVDVGKTLLGARDLTPIEKFNASAKEGLSNLAPYNPPDISPLPPEIHSLVGVQQPLPTITGPLFDLHQTPNPPDLSQPALNFDDLLQPGKGPVKGMSGKASIYKNDQPVAAHVTNAQRTAMEKASYGGFKVDDGSVQDFGRTRNRLVTEEHPELAAEIPQAIADAAGLTKQMPTALPPASSIQLPPSSLGESAVDEVTRRGPGTAPQSTPAQPTSRGEFVKQAKQRTGAAKKNNPAIRKSMQAAEDAADKKNINPGVGEIQWPEDWQDFPPFEPGGFSNLPEGGMTIEGTLPPKELPQGSQNTPQQAQNFMETAAQNLFGKPVNQLTYDQLKQVIPESVKLQNAARGGPKLSDFKF